MNTTDLTLIIIALAITLVGVIIIALRLRGQRNSNIAQIEDLKFKLDQQRIDADNRVTSLKNHYEIQKNSNLEQYEANLKNIRQERNIAEHKLQIAIYILTYIRDKWYAGLKFPFLAPDITPTLRLAFSKEQNSYQVFRYNPREDYTAIAQLFVPIKKVGEEIEQEISLKELIGDLENNTNITYEL